MKRSAPVTAVIGIVLLTAAGCGGGGQSAAPSEEAQSEAPASQAPTGLVTTVEELPNATIQIVATGSFVSPEWGEYEGGGSGSGFIVDPSGIAVTNSHVVSGAGTVEVHVGGEAETINAQILGVSECNDLAVIDLEGDGYSYLDWHDGAITPGLDVIAAGYPLGDPQFTVTSGIISKSDFTQADQWASVDAILEHDARIRPGNSGGPLVTEDEMAVIGVNYAGRDDTDQNYAISVTDAQAIVDQLAQGIDVDSVGVNGYAVTADDGTTGIWVETVQPGSGADAAGVAGGDIITRMAGISLGVEGTMAEFCDVIRTQGTDAVIPLEVVRYDTSQVLRGQVNGEPLAEAFSFAEELEDEGTVDETGDTYDEYTLITDDTEAVQVEIPVEWSDIDGEPYTDPDGNAVIDVRAAPSLSGFHNAWDTPGMIFSASSAWAGTYTTQSLLDAAGGSDACEYAGREPYEDPAYTGYYDLYVNCGDVLATYVIVAAEPADGSSLILVQVQANEERDFDALDHILASFLVIGDV